MNAAQLLSEMQSRRIVVSLQDGRLKITAPKGSLTEEIKQALGIHRDAIVAALFEEASGPPPIARAAPKPTCRASFAQERLWFLSQYEEQASAYAMPTAVRLKGHFDLAAFQSCVEKIVARHTSLRAVFEDMGGEAHLRVLAPRAIDVPFRIVDLAAYPHSEREKTAILLVEEEVGGPFDLPRGPLLRVLVIDMAGTTQDEYIIVFTMHHIVSDGWSSEVLLREFAAIYDAQLRGANAQLPPLPLDYVDFCVWQREWLSGAEGDRQLAHWRQSLAGAKFTLDLPADRPRPRVQSTAGDAVRFEISAERVNRLRDIARQEGATLYMIMLAAFFVLLSRWTGEKDICVGSPVANRRRVELEGVIGLFANTLVMRGDLSGNPDFLSFLARVRRFCLNAQEHQDLPLEQLVDALAPARDLSRNPLFQIMFSLQNAPLSTLSLPGVDIEPFETPSRTSKFDLSVELLEGPDGRLLGEAEYVTALFDRTTIERMVGQYQTVLDGIIETPVARLCALEILPKEERGIILRSFNAPSLRFEDGLLHELFAFQARRAPEAVALVHNGERLSYQQLDVQANRLAHWLVRQGIGPDVVVGLCLERSFEMIVAILAVLKAGGAYLPLDPALPDERLASMVEDAAPRVLLMQEKLRARLAATVDVRQTESSIKIFPVDSGASLLQSESVEVPENKARSGNLAYLIYTSGSTGKPKAVAVTHANVTRLFAATQDVFDISAADVWTLFHSYAFDFSVWEIWGALLYGGRLVIVQFLVSRSPEHFYRLLVAEGVTVLNQTPSAFYRLDEVSSPEGDLALRLVIFGGEALDQRRLALWFERHRDGQPRLVNMYGITETTVHVTLKELRREDAHGAEMGTVGRPLHDLSCYILDESFSLAPIGVCGEIFVGGAGLARGYLNRPELTADRFVPNPFSGAGERLYRTGDLARYRVDGEIEYLGRADHQVKIRGFRIELGEIEAALRRLPGVSEAAALVREDAEGGRCLVAWVATDDVSAFDAEAAKTVLRGWLPDYMIPAAIGAINQLPLNQNGKLDRKALPDIDGRPTSAAYVAPRTPAEWIILHAFRETLGIDAIGMNDNFFELGGNSILGLKLVDRIRRSLNEAVFVAAIFRAPTPRELADLIGKETPSLASPLLRLGANHADSAPLYCIHPAGGSTVRYRSLAQRLEPICGVYGVQSRTLLDTQYKARSIQEIAQDYSALIRRHQPIGPYRLAGWSAGAIVALAIASELEREGELVAFIGLLDPAIDLRANGAETSMAGYLASFAEFQDVRLDLSEQDLSELVALGADLDDRARFIAAGLWGLERGLWSDISAELLALLYDDSCAFETMLAEHKIEPIVADVHVWWARGARSAAARHLTRGALYSKPLDVCHESIVVDAAVHDEIAAILTDLQQAAHISSCEVA